jgi:hypothetical protein
VRIDRRSIADRARSRSVRLLAGRRNDHIPSETFWRTDWASTRPCTRRSSGRRPIPDRIATIGDRAGRLGAVDEHAAALRLAHPGDRLDELGAPAPDQAGQPDDLARAHGERHRRGEAFGHDVAQLEHDVARRALGAVEEPGQLAPDHEPGEVVVGQLVAPELAGDAPVAEHERAVGQAADLAQALGDEHDGQAVRAQALDEREQPLGVGQARRRLVEDEQPRVGRQGLGHLDELAVARPERDERRARVEVPEPDPLEVRQRAAGEVAAPDALHRRLQVAEQDVLADRHRRHDGELLRDQGDPGVERVARARERVLLAGEDDAAGVRADHAGDDLRQRRLARAVLAGEGEDLAAVDRRVDVGERLHGAEALGDARRPEQDLAHPGSSTPSWRQSAAMSSTCQISAIRPSGPTRATSMPLNSTRRPVAGMPGRSPVWVPRNVQKSTPKSPSSRTPCSSISWSGNAVWNASSTSRRPSCPGRWPGTACGRRSPR